MKQTIEIIKKGKDRLGSDLVYDLTQEFDKKYGTFLFRIDDEGLHIILDVNFKYFYPDKTDDLFPTMREMKAFIHGTLFAINLLGK